MSRLGFSSNLHCAPNANLSLCGMQNEFSGVPQQQSDLQSNSSATSGAELSPLQLSFAHHQLLPGTANNLNGNSANPSVQVPVTLTQKQQLVAAMSMNGVGVNVGVGGSADAVAGASSASSANSGGSGNGVAPPLSPPAKSFAPLQKDTTFTKIFVGGLPYHTSDDSLRKYFEQFGDIEEAVVITDRQTNKSRGYGFVTMSDRDSALRACLNPNPIIDGRKANVNLAYLGAKPRSNQLAGIAAAAAAALPLASALRTPGVSQQIGLQQQYLLPTPNGLMAVPSSVASGLNPAMVALLASQAQGGAQMLNPLAIAQLQQLAQLNAAANGVPNLMQPGGAGAQNAGSAAAQNELAAAAYTAQLMAAAAAAAGRPALMQGALMANGGGEGAPNGSAFGGQTSGDANQLLTPNYLYTLQALQQMQQAQAAGGQVAPGLGFTLNPQAMQLAAMYQAQAAAHAAQWQDRL